MSIEPIIILSLIVLWVILTIIELTNLNNFNLKFYDFGITIFRKEINVHFSNWNYQDGIYEEQEGKFVFIPEMRKGYFVTRFRTYRRYGIIGVRSYLPLTIFGQFEEIDYKLIIEYKISFKLALLIGTIVLAWFCLPLLTKMFSTLLVSIIGSLITSLIVYIIYRFKKMKMILLADEIKKLLKLKE